MSIKGISPSELLKRVVVELPWLLVVIIALNSYSGLTAEELSEALKLSVKVVKRAVWWLKKFKIVDEKSGKLFISKDFTKAVEELLYSYCNLGSTHVVQVDNVFIIIHVRNSRNIYYWYTRKGLYEKLLEMEKFAGTILNESEVASLLSIPVSEAAKLIKLRRLLEKCRSSQRS